MDKDTFFDFIRRQPRISAKANKKKELLLGEKMWKEITSTLPEAIGSLKEDASHIEQFREKADKLDENSKKALIKWLEDKIYQLDICVPDMLTNKEEEMISHERQIYQQHLDAIR